MRYFVQFSGGLESVALVINEMKKDPGGVYDLFHLVYDGGCKNFWQAQLSATVSLVKEMKVEYPKAEINLLTFPRLTVGDCTSLDLPYIHMISMMYIRRSKRKYAKVLNGIFRYHNGTEDRELAHDLVKLYGLEIPVEFPFRDGVKAEVYKMIPPRLAALCWACSKPTAEGDFYIPCGLCKKCAEYKKHNIELHDIDGSNVQELVSHTREFDRLLAEMNLIL